MKINPRFKAVATTKKRYSLITGGRGSAKSFTIATMLENLTWEKDHVILFTRYTMTAANISIIPEFVDKIDRLGHSEHFHVTKNEILNKVSGSRILFRGIKTSSGVQTANLKSIEGLTTFVVDEAEEFVDEGVFDTIDLSVRSDKQKNRVILIMNPASIDHWIYKRWFEDCDYQTIQGHQVQISRHPELMHLHTTYIENASNLSQSFIDRVEHIKETNPDKYKRLMLGAWKDREDGVVFEEYTIGEFQSPRGYVFGLDYGYYPDPLALVQVAVDQRNMKIYLKERLYGTKISEDQIETFLKDNLRRTDLIVADTSENRTTDALRGKGWNCRPVKKVKIMEDIRAMQDYELIIDPSSTNLIKELNNYIWNDKRADLPIDDYNHGIDAARYGFRRMIGKGIQAW